ncbi:hypothetical protein WT08_02215 [Burkholderia sp. MSMB1552]|nr:hypothetical protein WT08_02215 [Burkholderia sp. MSMB1552]KWZ55485.1 hypothetical protein WS92_05865 [Burkholderia sp. MSMB1588]
MVSAEGTADERAAFERYVILSTDQSIERDSRGEYVSQLTREWWRVWQARAAASPAAEWPTHDEAIGIYRRIRAQAHRNPIGYIEADELEKLGSPEFADVPENHVRLWHPANPPSRALIPVYCAPQQTGEPFGWISRHDFEIGDGVALVGANTKADDVPLYTAPQPAQADAPAACLTEQSIVDAVKKWFPDRAYQARFFARALLNGAEK